MTDLVKLRTLAEAALADSEAQWTYIDGPLMGDVCVETRPQAPGRSRIRLDLNAIGPFIAATSPGAIIELIERLELSRATARNFADQVTALTIRCDQLSTELLKVGVP